MAEIEAFFELKIAPLAPGEAPPAGVRWVSVLDPTPKEAARWVSEGWFLKP